MLPCVVAREHQRCSQQLDDISWPPSSSLFKRLRPRHMLQIGIALPSPSLGSPCRCWGQPSMAPAIAMVFSESTDGIMQSCSDQDCVMFCCKHGTSLIMQGSARAPACCQPPSAGRRAACCPCHMQSVCKGAPAHRAPPGPCKVIATAAFGHVHIVMNLPCTTLVLAGLTVKGILLC